MIASPVSPTPAFASGEKVDDPLAMYLMDIYTISANLAGLCAVSCPCGTRDTFIHESTANVIAAAVETSDGARVPRRHLFSSTPGACINDATVIVGQ